MFKESTIANKQEIELEAEEKEDLDSAYIENLLDKLFLTEKIQKVNEGHNGVILKLDLRVFSPEERQDFCEHFGIPYGENDNLAIKMIKIYQAEQVKKEFSAQRKAAKLINSSDELNNLIGVPECYQGQEVALTKESLKQKLKDNDIDISSEKFSLIMMDFIEGEDLGMFCYKQYIKTNFEKFKELYEVRQEATEADIDLYLKDKSISDLINICNYISGGKSNHHYLDDSLEARQERNERAKLIIGRIENRGLFPKETVSALRQALTLLHNKGIYHGDLHFRNLIIEAVTGKLFMIDFGSAKVLKGSSQERQLQEAYKVGEEGLNDEAMVIYLDRLSKTPADFLKSRIELDLGVAKKIHKIALSASTKDKLTAKEKKIAGAWQKLKQQVEAGEAFDKAVKGFGYDLGGYNDGDDLFYAQIGGLLLLVDAGYLAGVKNYCQEVINQPKANQAFKNKLNLLLEYLD